MGKVSELWLTCGGILLMLCVPSVLGWGAQGHFAICKIAQVIFILFVKMSCLVSCVCLCS